MHPVLIIILILLLLWEAFGIYLEILGWYYGAKLDSKFLLRYGIRDSIKSGMNKHRFLIRALDRKPLLLFEKLIPKDAKTTFRLFIYEKWCPDPDGFDQAVQITEENAPHSWSITTQRKKKVLIVEIGRDRPLATKISRRVLNDVFKIDPSIKLRSCTRGPSDPRGISHGWEEPEKHANDTN